MSDPDELQQAVSEALECLQALLTETEVVEDCLEAITFAVEKAVVAAEAMGFEPVWGEEELPDYGTHPVIVDYTVVWSDMVTVMQSLQAVERDLEAVTPDTITREKVLAVTAKLDGALAPVQATIDNYQAHMARLAEEWDGEGW